jgi:hypothetical protein
MASLGTFNPSAVALTSNGYYTDYTLSGDISITFSGTPVEGTWQIVTITFNGSYTITLPEDSVIVNNSFVDGAAPLSGTYDLWFIYVGAEYKLNLQKRTLASFLPSSLVPQMEYDGFLGVTEATGVSVWANQGLSGGSYFESTGGNQPTYTSGTGEISFNGTTGRLQLSGTLRNSLVDDTQGTFFIVGKTTSLASEFSLFNLTDASANSRFGIRLYTDSKLGILARPAAGWSYSLSGDTTILANTWYIISVTSNGSTITATVNGTSQTLTVALGANNGDWLDDPDNIDQSNLGFQSLNSATSYQEGSIKYLFYRNSALNAGEITQMESYLNARFSVY